MKKLAVLCFSLLLFHSFGQRLSIGVFSSADVGTDKDNVTSSAFSNLTVDGTTEAYSQNRISFSDGNSYGIGANLLFSEHFGLGLDMVYSKSFEFGAEEDFDASSDFSYRMSATSLRFNPNVILSTADSNAFTFYTKFGLLINKSNVTRDIIETTTTQDSTVEWGYEYDSPWNVGLSSAIGFEYKIGPMVSFFAELHTVTLSVSPESATLTYYSSEGVDLMGTTTESERSFEFLDSYETDFSTLSTDDPTQRLKFNLPFSSVGLKVGARINF